MRAVLRALATVAAMFTAALAPAAVAVPAAAAAGFTHGVADLTVPANQQTAETSVRLTGPAGSYTGVTVVIDTRPLAGVARLEDPSDYAKPCTNAEAVWTCTLDSVALAQDRDTVALFLRVTSTAEAVPGARVAFRTTLTAAGMPSLVDDTTVTIGGDVRLRTNGRDVRLSGAPGERFDLVVPLVNLGIHPSPGVVLRIHSAMYEIVPAERYRNCWYPDPPSTGDIICVFDTAVAPGAQFEARAAFQLRPDSIHGTTPMYATWQTPAEAARTDQTPGASRGTQGTGGELVLSPFSGTMTDINYSLQVWVTITGDTPADLAAVGATVTGEVGQTVTVRLGIHNVGTVTVDPGMFNGETLYGLSFAVPAGTTVVATPDGCEFLDDSAHWDPGAPARADVPAYFCSPDGILLAGDTRWIAVSLRIDRAVTASTGRVHVFDAWPSLFQDGNPTNNTATLTVTGGATAAGPDPGLPVTGGPAIGLAVTGGLLVLAGLGLVTLTRRRTRRGAGTRRHAGSGTVPGTSVGGRG